MALDWSLNKIKNHETVCWIPCSDDQSSSFDTVRATKDDKLERMNPTTTVLIWSTMSLGVSEITKKNVDHFYSRLRMWEKVSGPNFVNEDNSSNYITYEDVHNHIGLSTNASPIPNLKFLAKMKDYVLGHK